MNAAANIPEQILWQAWPVETALNRWNVTPVSERHYPGVAAKMADKVTYAFENGWVDTGDLPCRTALRAELSHHAPTCPTDGFSEVYVGGDTPAVDYSDFCHLPTWRVRHARVRLNSDAAQTLQMNLMTCGGVRVWLDGVAVHRFEPFRRNQQSTSDFQVSVPAGVSTLTIRFEDLHERDTIFGFQLRLLAGENLATGIDAPDVAGHQIAAALDLLAGLRCDQVFYESGAITVTSDALPAMPIAVRCATLGGQSGVISDDHPTLRLNAPAGCPVMRFDVVLGPLRLSRSIGTTVLTGSGRIDGADTQARREQLLARFSCPGDIAETLVALRAGRFGDAAAAAFDTALNYVETRRDCADFRMMALLWIWRDHAGDLPDTARDRLRGAILGFRYWMDEPGNDVMWFWSENHVLCFHIAQFLAGQMFPDAVFGNSRKSGADQQALGAARLHKWFDAVETHGLAEWNSAAYYPINYRALATLYTLSDDPALTERAAALMDQISAMVALHCCGGVPVGSQGRIYEKELLAGPMTELGAVAALLFGGAHVPGRDAAAVLVALSGYAAPRGLSSLAYPAPGQTVRARYVQGLNASARLALWKTEHAQLSSVQDHNPGTPGHQQHVIDLHFADDPLARIWVNHPGDLRTWGARRPSYWAGNGRLPRLAQNGRVALMHYALKADDIPFSHVFLPAQRLDALIAEDHWIFARCGQGYGAIWSSAPMRAVADGPYAGSEWRVETPIHAWALIAGDEARDGSFDAFQSACRAMRPIWRHNIATLTTPDGLFQLGQGGSADLNGVDLLPANAPLSVHPFISRSGGAFVPWTQLQDSDE